MCTISGFVFVGRGMGRLGLFGVYVGTFMFGRIYFLVLLLFMGVVKYR